MSWVSDSAGNNQYNFSAPQASYKQADQAFEKNINAPMMQKFQEKNNGKKQRMAGDYLSDFTSKYSDNSQSKEVRIKDYRGDAKNNNVSSFLGNSAPQNVSKQPQDSGSTQSNKPVGEVTSQPKGVSQPKDYTSWTSDDWINAYEQNNDVADTWNKEQVTTYADGRKEMSGTTARMNIQKGYQNQIDQVKWLNSYQGPTTWDEAFAPDLATSKYKGNLNNLNKYNTAVRAKEGLEKQYAEWNNKSAEQLNS